MTTAVADVLDGAAAVYSRKAWSQFRVALDADGRPLDSATDKRAQAICALGAVAIAAVELAADDAVVVEAVDVFRRYVNAETVARWNEEQATHGDYVRQRLHAAAREHRRGGPAHVPAHPPRFPGEVPPEVAPRRKARSFTPESQLRVDRGRLVSVLVRQRKANAPEADIAATEGRIRSVEKRLREEFGVTDLRTPGVDPPDPTNGEVSAVTLGRRLSTVSGL